MNIFLKFALLSFIGLSSGALTSCDSGSNDALRSADIKQFPEARAESLDSVRPNDIIILTDAPGSTPVLTGEITASSTIQFQTATGITMDYLKNSDHGFSLKGSLTNPKGDFNSALATLLSVGSPSAIRTLLNRRGAAPLGRGNWNEVDLLELTRILQDQGLPIIFDGDSQQILYVKDYEYFFDVESNNASLFSRGEMSGIFSSNIVYFPVGFSEYSDNLVLGDRVVEGLTGSDDIPFVDDTKTVTKKKTQFGTFTFVEVAVPVTVP